LERDVRIRMEKDFSGKAEPFLFSVKLDREDSEKKLQGSKNMARFSYMPGYTLRFYINSQTLTGKRPRARLFQYIDGEKDILLKEFYGSPMDNNIVYFDYKVPSKDELMVVIDIEDSTSGCAVVVAAINRLVPRTKHPATRNPQPVTPHTPYRLPLIACPFLDSFYISSDFPSSGTISRSVLYLHRLSNNLTR